MWYLWYAWFSIRKIFNPDGGYRVTFDSNVFGPTARPASHQNDPDKKAFRKINAAIKAGWIQAHIAETMLTLEAIKKVDRQGYFATTTPKVDVTETESEDGSIGLSVKIGPDPKAHPGLVPIMTDRVKEAIDLGFRLLRCPRTSLPRPKDLDDAWFALDTDEDSHRARQQRYFDIAAEIEKRGVGVAVIKGVAATISTSIGSSDPWYEMLDKTSNPNEISQIKKGVAEWADGDAVAAHVGYDNHLFCSRDLGKSAGTHSILDATNRSWLATNHNVEFVSPAELGKKLCN